MQISRNHRWTALLLALLPLGAMCVQISRVSASPTSDTIYLPLIQRSIPDPQIQITAAQAQRFPVPYGYGLRMGYTLLHMDPPDRVADYVTTQYSHDGGQVWITDEAQRSPEYDWDNLHGEIHCGATSYNLESNHKYTLRALLTWHDAHGTHQTTSNLVTATVSEYDCDDMDQDGIPDTLEGALAETFFPELWARWQVSDRQQFYPYHDTPGWHIPYTVSHYSEAGHEGFCDQADFQCLQIRYGLAYQWDCGDNPGNGCSGINNHLGDSEFHALLVAREAPDGSWGTGWEAARERAEAWRQVVSQTFAHWGAITDSSRCHYYLTPRSARATLYVAEGKHATYHSVSDCDDGGFFGSDYCVDEAHGGMDLRSDLSPIELQNVGEPGEHFLFDTTITDPADPTHDTYEVWSEEDFGEGGSFYTKFVADLTWAHWWWTSSPGGEGCGDPCSCRAGDEQGGGG